MLIFGAQILNWLYCIGVTLTAMVALKYYIHSSMWTEYSPITPFYNRRLKSKLNQSIQRARRDTSRAPASFPSLNIELKTSLEGIDAKRLQNLIKESETQYQANMNCVLPVPFLSSPTEKSTLLLFIPENRQYFLMSRQRLGEGESGAKTFLGENIETGELVAIKKTNLTYNSDMVPYDILALSKAQEYFTLQENQHLLEHGKLIGQLVKRDLNKKSIYTIMPFYDSKKHTQLDHREKIHLAISLAQEISSIHRKGYLHNDLHIENICWDGKKCHLIDFGSMTNLHSYTQSYFYTTRSKFSHLSLEGLFGFNSCAKDIYAFGKTLKELFTDLPAKNPINQIISKLTHPLPTKRMPLNEAIDALKNTLEVTSQNSFTPHLKLH